VCLWTHCNIGSKRACCAVPLRVMLNREGQAWRRRHAECCAESVQWRHHCRCLMTNVVRNVVDGSDRRNLFSFRGLIAAKPYVPHQNLRTLGMSASRRNNSYCQKLCRLSGTPITNIPSKVPIFSCFWDL